MVMRQARKKVGLAAMLLFVTAVVLIVQATGLQKTRVIDPIQDFSYSIIDDRAEGGASVGEIQVVDNKLIIKCEIIASQVKWPYCTLSINLVKNDQGVDLSGYTNFKLWIKYVEPRDSGIRFQVRNFDPAYSSRTDDLSLKYNSIEFYKKNSTYPVVVPLQSFQVPTWWLVLRELSPENGVPEFTNVHSLDVATGYVISPGKYEIIIERIELTGKFISGQHIYLLLLVIWGALGLFYVIHKLFFTKELELIE